MKLNRKTMNKLQLTCLLLSLLIFSTIGFGDSVIKEFRAEPGMNKVYLAWYVSLETDINGYKVLKGFDPTQLRSLEFINATSETIPPGSTKKYEYTDKSVFKSDGRSYYYQIAVMNKDGQIVTSTEIREVSPNVSAVRHTWGSIKAIFR